MNALSDYKKTLLLGMGACAASCLIVSPSHAFLGGFETEDGYVHGVTLVLPSYNAGQFGTNNGGPGGGQASIPYGTGLWKKLIGIENPTIGPFGTTSYGIAHDGQYDHTRHGVSGNPYKALVITTNSEGWNGPTLKYEYTMDARDFNGTAPSAMAGKTFTVDFWWCPKVWGSDEGGGLGAGTIADVIEFKDSAGNVAFSVGLQQPGTTIDHVITKNGAAWVDSSIVANNDAYSQWSITFNTTAQTVTVKYFDINTGITTVLRNNEALVTPLDYLKTMTFESSPGIGNAKLLAIDDFSVSQPTTPPAWNDVCGMAAYTRGVLKTGGPQYTLGIMDLRNPVATTPSGTVWYPNDYHHEDWTIDKIGNVFGITFDDSGNLYAAASSQYNFNSDVNNYTLQYGSIGGGENSLTAAGTVYKMDKATRKPVVFVQLPQQASNLTWVTPQFYWIRNTGPGLGDIAWASTQAQFYISNFEDGKIYRVNSAGTILGNYDPLVADDGVPGFCPREQRVYAVQVHDGKLYYSVWRNTLIWPAEQNRASALRCVDLDANGAPIAATDMKIWQLSNLTDAADDFAFNDDTYISDLSFAADGRLLIGTRPGNGGDTLSTNGNGRVYILQKDSGGIWQRINAITPGNNLREGIGGAAWGVNGATKEAFIWVNASDMLNQNGPHGLQGWAVADTPTNGQVGLAKSLHIPFDSAFGNVARSDASFDFIGINGDVEIACPATQACCPELIIDVP